MEANEPVSLILLCEFVWLTATYKRDIINRLHSSYKEKGKEYEQPIWLFSISCKIAEYLQDWKLSLVDTQTQVNLPKALHLCAWLDAKSLSLQINQDMKSKAWRKKREEKERKTNRLRKNKKMLMKINKYDKEVKMEPIVKKHWCWWQVQWRIRA